MSSEVVEDDEAAAGEDNTLGRLLTLSDGVFAIAMTLLALELKVPSLPHGSSDAALRHALAHEKSSYLSFLISFYVVGSYWGRHRRLMRRVKHVGPDVIRVTMLLLLCVAALPFPAALLGTYGSDAISLVVYGGLNAIAVFVLLRLHYLLRDPLTDEPPDPIEVPQLILTLIVFVILIPAGYVFDGSGAWVMISLVFVRPAVRIWRWAAARGRQ